MAETSKFRQGLARMQARGGLGAALFPLSKEVAAETDPETLRLLRRQALLQMGLGMLGARDRGAGLGGGALFGMEQGQQALQGGLGQIMGVRRMKREDERLDLAERRAQIAEDRTNAYMTRQEEQDKIRAAERAEDVQWRKEQAEAAARRAATDDARMLEDSNLRNQITRDAQARQAVTDRLTASVARLRAVGVDDKDPLMIRLLTEAKGLGVDLYTRKTGLDFDLSPANEIPWNNFATETGPQ